MSFLVPLCANCGHPEGDHQSNRPMNALAPILAGLCRHPGCDCERYVPEDKVA